VAGIVNSPGTVQDNYALNTMRVEKDTYAKRYSPDTVTPVAGPNTSSGADISASALKNQSFWAGSTTLGFSSDDWDFSRVVIDGHPVLKNMEG
jgi:hypothetical protein